MFLMTDLIKGIEDKVCNMFSDGLQEKNVLKK